MITKESKFQNRLTVFIPCAGVGSRVENELDVNKALLTVGTKPAICHIIDSFPSKTEFVISLGYKGQFLKNFLKDVYANKKFLFKSVRNYSGKGSGLGRSLYECKMYLQKPFIFISCDTIVLDKIKIKNKNWIGLSKKRTVNEYRKAILKGKKINDIKEKNFISKKKLPVYIGLSEIFDYKNFWRFADIKNKEFIQKGESFIFDNFLKKDINITYKFFKWFDTGNLIALKDARNFFQKKENSILPKKNEAIWFVNDLVIKYHKSQKFIKQRALRQKFLKGFTPNIIIVRKNYYIYKKVNGEVLSRSINLKNFKNFLNFNKIFWKKKKLESKEKKAFYKNCLKFYKNKTFKRINQFYKSSLKKDNHTNINNIKIPKLDTLLKKINWENISKGQPTRFHGDLHFENVLYHKKKFTYLDWRQEFEGRIDYGDIYYDLAKIMHGLYVSHKEVVKDNFSVNWTNKKIEISIKSSYHQKKAIKFFEKWLIKNNFDIKKVKILTSLIYLNICPLHHNPYNLFLYALGKSMLFKTLGHNEK